jgi:hypothetical protein
MFHCSYRKQQQSVSESWNNSMSKSSQEPAKHEDTQESYSTVYNVMSKIRVWLGNRSISINPLVMAFTTKIEDCKKTTQSSSKIHIMNSEVNIQETCE